jgi:T3SS (YopN, CesT) and YbjN peptide-binding chaperone 1/TY-Chap C-terminal domain/T3SS (YopN, CesT) and YbjN peptide-binding chaperone 3
MQDSALRDLGPATDDAWRRFRHELADQMADLQSDDLVEVLGESLINDLGFEYTPCLEFSRDGDVLFGRVTGDCVHAKAGVSKKARRRLAAIGWYKEKSPNGVVQFRAEVAVSHADVLAAMTVAALREVFEVAHPASLTGDVSLDDGNEPFFADGGCVTYGPLAIDPTDRDHLDQLIDETLAQVLGHVPERDGDGDVAVTRDTSVVYVSTLPSAAAIRVWAEVAVQVTELDRARLEVEILNRDHELSRYLLVGNRITVEMHLLASPFVPEQLTTAFTLICDLAEEADDDLVARVSGHRFLESGEEPIGSQSVAVEDETDDETLAAMMTLLQLDADGPGSVSPAMAAHVCGNDQELLLRLITSEEEQEIEWLKARDEAHDTDDSEELADVCEHERAHAEQSVKLLRKALRYVVERDFHRASA